MVNDSYYMVIIWLMMVNNNNNVGGWALPLWKMMEFVSWDDDIPNVWENKMHVSKTTNQVFIKSSIFHGFL